MSEELTTNGSTMDKSEFEAKLTEFFSKNKESKLRLVSRIAEEFHGHENEVLEYLQNKYVLKNIPEKSKKQKEKPSANGHTDAVASEAKPKSKKKLIIIIVIVIVVAGLGAGAFFMKDKLFGKKEPAATETPAAETKPVEQPKQEAPPAETKTDSVPVVTDSAAVDTTKK